MYSDLDTEMIHPMQEWVPIEYKDKTKFIVGFEHDQDPPWVEVTYPIQFCQWTFAGGKDHPVLWAMVERILDKVKAKQVEMKEVDFTDDEVLTTTGSAAWTEVIFEYLDKAAGTGANFTWHNLTGMTEPRLIGDMLVLPIDSFGSEQPHSHSSSKGENGALTVHNFDGSWRGD